jgi:tetratricopeptide (TPR) repeat protein
MSFVIKLQNIRATMPRLALIMALIFAINTTRLVEAQSIPSEPPSAGSARVARNAARRGEEFRRKWNLESAEAAFREATTADPSNLEAALGLARIAQAKSDYVESKRLLDDVARYHPNSADLLAAYGSLYIAAEETQRAAEYFDKALRIDPQLSTASIGRAEVDLLRRDYKNAEERLHKYLEHDPQSARARSVLARVLLENSRNKEAAEEAERALLIDPFETDALHALAFARAVERKSDEVRSLARRALALNPSAAAVRRLMAQYLNGRTGYEQKIDEAARKKYERGMALKQEGQLAKAALEFESALQIEPNYYRALLALGDVRLREEDYSRAAAVAKRAIEVDADGSVAHLQLSYALIGMQERARLEIGAEDFAEAFYRRPSPPVYELTRKVFPNYDWLTRRRQEVIDRAIAPLAHYLPKLARSGARHILLTFDQRITELAEFQDVLGEKTFDGRYYASIRGVGGRTTVSGIEYIEAAARGGFHTIAHELAHQIHMAALDREDVRTIRLLYEDARRRGRALDYYAAENEYEYFAQGYEAFISERKRPSAGVTARHTRSELAERDPELYRFLIKLTAASPLTAKKTERRSGINSIIEQAAMHQSLLCGPIPFEW